MQGTNWVKTKSELPKPHEPVLLVFHGRVYNSVFYFQGWRWSFVDDDDSFIALHSASHWMYIKDLPLPPMPEGE
ncbi:DUF551 domain-containing protein [Providencia rettgeri]|uniref:DUF551 domain-containing protein n=1 Tax=Providencia rettgeri TaxID=587 RepID=UPI0023606732|nr:DUF551 domain-containing protein [Providencia rettgeri]